MEWVETTGRTLDEAKDAALDQLGVDEDEAEFEVIEEAKSGLFGRLRQEARVRARVRPATPRPKVDRRERRRKSPRGGREGGDQRDTERADATSDSPTDGAEAPKPAPRSRKRAESRPRRESRTPATPSAPTRGADMVDGADLAEQRESAQEFLEGLLDAFGLDGDVVVEEVEEDILAARVDGDDLGLLIGPKGQTLQAVQELARSAIQRGSGRGARLRLDIGGYKERRREALERFTRQLAEQVLASGTPTSLEPMNPADRKVVHDTINTIDGVTTRSEGEEDDRHVVILPEGDDD